uniref:J domain-containing protein n=1 Tax=Schistosoma curassoni TaxID=6186 RepID=A0A183JGG1_9TREM
LEKYNAYDILGVKQSATFSEIKSAYYDLSKCLHPDRLLHTNPEKLRREEFQLVTAAYELLRDQETRSQYDRYLASNCLVQTDKIDKSANFDARFQHARNLYMRHRKSRTYKSYRRGPDEVVEEFRSKIKTNVYPKNISDYYTCEPQPRICTPFLLTITLSTFLLYCILKLN